MTNADWMGSFSDRDDLTLPDITFPGSHDAGLQEAQGGFTPMSQTFQGRDDTICQYTDIAGQLLAGSRALDLRIRNHNGVLRTYHSEGAADVFGLGGWGQRVDTIFSQVDAFLAAHRGEIVIMRISHTKEKEGVHNYISALNPSRLFKDDKQRILANIPLSELKGKAILIFDKDALAKAEPEYGLHRFSKKDGDGAASHEKGLEICGKYPGFFAGTFTNNQMMREITHVALKKGQEHGKEHRPCQVRHRTKHDHLFMIYWQLAFNVKSKTVSSEPRNKDLDQLEDEKGTHHNLDYLLNAFRGDHDLYHVTHNPKIGFKKKLQPVLRSEFREVFRPNWINLDFIDSAICSKVIEFNTELLPPAPRRSN